MKRALFILLVCAAGWVAAAAEAGKPPLDLSKLPPPATGPVDYTADIQPIFAQNCYSCHGAEKQRGGLRLDHKEPALTGGDAGRVILPGESAQSILIHYVAGLDPDTIMPPKGDRLTADQIGKLRAWIDTGAQWPDEGKVAELKVDHWAFKPPVRHAPPKVNNSKWARNPIDNFVLARLEPEGIQPSPEADRRTLIRRLCLDLLGLPPTPEQVAAFVNDRRPDAYEKLVDDLLASPHFGERWGRHWLDQARYADSDGYEKDLPRPYAYLFRDWVIKAINDDLPFDQFTLEQLAGDLLPDATEEQKIATGFHRQTLTNREGGTDKEEFRCKSVVDRVSTTGTVWLGLSVGCAECHSHKYDPITQREFYQLYAFFNNASEKDIPAPRPHELTAYEQELAAWQKKLHELEAPLDDYVKNQLGDRLAAWESSLQLPAERWTILDPQKVSVTAEGDETLFNAQKDKSIVPRPRDTVRSRYRIDTTSALEGITGFRLEAIAESGRTVGRGAKGSFGLSEFAVAVETARGELQPLKIARAAATHEEKEQPVTQAIDGHRTTSWSVGADVNRSHAAVFELAEPLTLPPGARLVFRVEHFEIGLMAKFRLAATTGATPLTPDATPDAIVAILDTPAAGRTEKQTKELARYFAERIDAEGMKLYKAVASHNAKKPKYPETVAAVLVADPRRTHIHVRGDFLQKGDEVQPGVIQVLHPLKPRATAAGSAAQPDRLDLARWLVDPANPLTARVTVNHFWQYLFGRALVPTVNDFGTRGDPPSHPELLDWLATEFQRLGWSRKQIIKTILTSATYRQSSRIRPELIERDPLNTLLARQNRYRLEAEVVRDINLAASGLLHPEIGGPSIRPPLPPDIAALGYANQVKWENSKGADQYRRGLYIFFQRTVPYPMLMTFDAPDSTVTCTRRERSNTPLQALTLLNNVAFFQCAQALGKQLHRRLGNPRDQLSHGFERVTARKPTKAELDRLVKLYEDQLRLVQSNPDAAAKLVGGKSDDSRRQSELPDERDPAEAAAMVAVSRVLLNLDEFITRE